jgi:hypothetical protein
MSTPGSQLFNFGSNPDNSGLFGGSNQYGQFPSLNMGTNGMTGTQIPGSPVNQQSSNLGTTSVADKHGNLNPLSTGPSTLQTNSGQWKVGQTQDPALTQQFLTWLQTNIGQGAPAFDWTSLLPSGGTTAPGQLSAPNNQMLQALQKSFQTGDFSGIAGLNTTSQMAKTGSPTDVGPAWEAMKQAEQANILKSQAQLKEGMNLSGNLAGSPMGTAMSDFQTDVTAQQNAQLTQAQQVAQEAAKGRMLTAGGEMGQVYQNITKYLQTLDQESVDKMYQEFIRTSPDYNPLLQNVQKGAEQYPPYLHTKDMNDQIYEGFGTAEEASKTFSNVMGTGGGGGGGA